MSDQRNNKIVGFTRVFLATFCLNLTKFGHCFIRTPLEKLIFHKKSHAPRTLKHRTMDPILLESRLVCSLNYPARNINEWFRKKLLRYHYYSLSGRPIKGVSLHELRVF